MNQEAELGDAAENAVYRAMLFGLRSRGIWSRLPPLLRGVAVGLSIFLLSGLFSTFWPVLLVVWFSVRHRRSTPSRFFAIPEALMEDLVQSPIPSREWTLALWARALRPGGRSATPAALFTFFGMLLGLTMLLAITLGPAPVTSYAWFAGSAGILAGGVPFLLIPSASAALPLVGRQLRGFRVELLRRRNPLLRLLMPAFRLLVIVAALFAASGLVVASMVTLSTGAIGTTLSRWAAYPSAPGTFFIAGFLMTSGIGAARRYHVKKGREAYLEMMDRDLSMVVEFLRYREDSREASASHRLALPKPADWQRAAPDAGPSQSFPTHAG